VAVSGTESRPVVEASFAGSHSAVHAARGACEVLAAVRRVQRAAENEFQVVGAITAGVAAPGPGGVTMTEGGPDTLLHRLREVASPGQILMSDAARLACEDMVDTLALTTEADGSVEAHLLRRIRPERMAFLPPDEPRGTTTPVARGVVDT